MPQPVPATFTQEALAELLGKRTSTLRHWRTRGTGPAFSVADGHVVYTADAVEQWLRAQTRGPAYPPVPVAQPYRRPRRRPYNGE